MCGACGRIVVADEVLGAERTLRSQHLVAQTIRDLCETRPGLPAVQVAGDGWTVRTPTGTVQPCRTVGEVWAVLLHEAGRSDSASALLDSVRRQVQESSGLAQAVLLAGLKAAKALPR